MTTGPEQLLILGVRHPDKCVPGLVKEHVEGGAVNKVFHESPEIETSTGSCIVWTIIKNPLAIFCELSGFSPFSISNLRLVVEITLSGKAGCLTPDRGGQTQGRQAARMVSENHGME